jgi:hypothetical protein
MIGLMALGLAAAPTVPPCPAAALSLATDAEGGAFDGMSQSGTLLVIRNIGPSACSVPGLPRLTLLDAHGKALPITRKAPIGMHPGPVVLPVGIAPGAEVTAKLHWVSGPVYDRNRCYDVKGVSVTIGGTAIRTNLSAHICGNAASGVTFGQPILQPDPRLD